ncbi:hypothetical protein EJB05_43632 [Eragrostis curvula]|uniref:Uncharacterized protein n=1 Tax=Eragrostis curvula TaxID=38414 RepID=A0A5J9TFD0_9POAL|nr:hypothetical protein EJB05_43632 [Eragrostis curvula]
MSKRLVSRLLGMFQSRTQVGVDKAGNRYFTRVEEVDGGSTCPHPSFPRFYLLSETFNLSSALDLLRKEDGTWMLANNQILVLLLLLVLISGATVKEKRWVEFKGADQDPTTVPVDLLVEWPKEESPITRVLKRKEEEERKAGVRPVKKIGKAESPNLQSFVKQQYTGPSSDHKKEPEEVSRPKDAEDATTDERSSEPTGTGATYKPGTWQPPT